MESFQPLCTLFCVSIWLSTYYSDDLNPHCCCMCYSPVALASRNIQMTCCHVQDYFSYCMFWYSVIFLQTAALRVSNWLLLTQRMCLSLSCSGISVWFCKCHQVWSSRKKHVTLECCCCRLEGRLRSLEDVVHEDITRFSKSAGAWHLQSAWKQTFNSVREKRLLFTSWLFKMWVLFCWKNITLISLYPPCS